MYVEEYLPFMNAAGPFEKHLIEAGAIRRFAEAIGDDDPIYSDAEYAKTTRYGKIIAPPTYSFTLKYPAIPGVWLAPVGRIHASQEFTFYKPICAGDTVYCRKKLIDAYEKDGKNGIMVFLVQEMGAYDENMEPYSVGIMTSITRGSVFENRDKLSTDAMTQGKGDFVERFAPPLRAGAELPSVTLPAMTRVDIAKYAGASGDFNAIHLDDDEAKKVGFPRVIAHGMISAALQGRIAKSWLGDEYEFTALQIRFLNPVFSGDILTFSGTVEAVDSAAGTAAVKYAVCNQNGLPIIGGTLTARSSPRG